MLVTGQVAAGKTRFLEALHRSTRRWWEACGFVCRAEPARRAPGQPAAVYRLCPLDGSPSLPWARRRADATGYEFDDASCATAEAAVLAALERDAAEICIVDELGPLELGGGGFAPLLRAALRSRCAVVVAAVKKRSLDALITAFGLQEPLVVDLDTVPPRTALRRVRRRIAACDAERIGACAGIAGLVEVGLGSTLHAYRVPLKGQLLASLQTVLLVGFGKSLRGRGLARIALLSALLKSFSPLGQRVRPMLYIALQGLCFATPVRLLGWNLGAVLLGAVLLGSFTLASSLAVDTLTFGTSFLTALSGAAASLSAALGLPPLSLGVLLGGAFVLRALLSIALGLSAYCWDLQPWIQRWSRARRTRPEPSGAAQSAARARRARPPALAALRDLLRPRFVLAFFVSTLLLLFFAKLRGSDLLGVVLRGLCVSYLGFLLLRRVNVAAFGAWLDRRTHLGLGKSLPAALAALGEAKTVPPARPTSSRAPTAPPR